MPDGSSWTRRALLKVGALAGGGLVLGASLPLAGARGFTTLKPLFAYRVKVLTCSIVQSENHRRMISASGLGRGAM